ncbi:hypothetical protein D3C73_1444450 [compost metagenome]
MSAKRESLERHATREPSQAIVRDLACGELHRTMQVANELARMLAWLRAQLRQGAYHTMTA